MLTFQYRLDILTCSTLIPGNYMSYSYFLVRTTINSLLVGRLRFAKTSARGEKGSQEAQDARPTSPEKH